MKMLFAVVSTFVGMYEVCYGMQTDTYNYVNLQKKAVLTLKLSDEDKKLANESITNFEKFKEYAKLAYTGSCDEFSCPLDYECAIVNNFFEIVKNDISSSADTDAVSKLVVLCFIYRCSDPYVADKLYKVALLKMMRDKKLECILNAENILNTLFPTLSKKFRQYLVDILMI